jgi:lactococcin 972 family bacteriocin
MRKITACATGVALALGSFTAAQAAVHQVGGGTWNQGVNSTTVWSHYYHGGKCHGSTAVGKWTAKSGNVRAGKWSYASTPRNPWGGNKSYYNFC